MRLPAWLTFLCAGMVILWGLYRIKLGLRDAAAEDRARDKKGLFAMPRRTHLLVGTIYLLLGAGLTAITLGWDPLAALHGRADTAPAEPVPGGVLEIERGR